ncbi:MAG: histidine kinase [Muribaculaceae bacterium]|nr:histidine kinase [Muribaculaceae bacterium]
MKLSNRELTLHVLCWGIVLFIPLFFFGPHDTGDLLMRRFLRGLGGPLSYMVLFYLNYLWLVPRLYFNDRKRMFFIINLVSVGVCLGFMFEWWELTRDLLADKVSQQPTGKMRHGPRLPMLFYNGISLILVVGLSLAISMSRRWQQIENARKAAEQSRMEAELTNLHNQLNPHFLLNTLNNIYALIAFDTAKAQTAVEELSHLLRHALYENQHPYVPLFKEVEFIHNYIELMKIRVSNDVTIVTDIDVAPDDATPVAPLLFICLIENAFKHGISPDGKGTIHVAIHQCDGVVTCDIINSNHPKRDNDKSGSGIGLEQVGKRLELMYPSRYTWQKGVNPGDNTYRSTILLNTRG